MTIGRRSSKAGLAIFTPVKGLTSEGKFAGPYPSNGYEGTGSAVGASVGGGVDVGVLVLVGISVAGRAVGAAVGADPQAANTIAVSVSTTNIFCMD
jgi:hypothetical protein